ncbi:MAG TPA: 50S ribosomal protein L25 [Gaiellaceae bacterium]|nr:50S ribosomal protein L25 [Gaiellaceae bacterium]
MAGERVKIDVRPRTEHGSADARRLRREGYVPGVLYGRDAPATFVVPERELRRVLTGPSGLHAILDVTLDGGETHSAILKDYQQDPVKGRLLHVDLQEVRLDQPITASVAVTLVGGEDAPGVREGGVLSQVAREVTVEALPMEIPEHIDVDVSGMEIGATLRLIELTAPEGVTFLDDPDATVVATITAPTRAIEEEEAEAAAAAAEEAGEEAAEGEEAAGEAAEGEAAGEPGTPEG